MSYFVVRILVELKYKFARRDMSQVISHNLSHKFLQILVLNVWLVLF